MAVPIPLSRIKLSSRRKSVSKEDSMSYLNKPVNKNDKLTDHVTEDTCIKSESNSIKTENVSPLFFE